MPSFTPLRAGRQDRRHGKTELHGPVHTLLILMRWRDGFFLFPANLKAGRSVFAPKSEGRKVIDHYDYKKQQPYRVSKFIRGLMKGW